MKISLLDNKIITDVLAAYHTQDADAKIKVSLLSATFSTQRRHR